MTLEADRYPQLQAFLRGYLHEDYLFQYGAALEARAAYLADASQEERREFGDDCRRFLRAIDRLPLPAVRTVLRRTFRCAWSPKTLVEVAAVLSPAPDPPRD